MHWSHCLRLILVEAVLSLSMAPASAEKQTVCTITVNSADEKEVFRRHLPATQYQFVELVERDRPDWLSSACRAAVSCDVLIISGHYDGSNEFFSDRLDAREFLPVDELERISCSDSCPGLFSRLKEAYLFGCNTLNPVPLSSVTAEIVRSLVREGHSLREAEQYLRALNAEHGESSRDRMRQVFKDVPVIYGFSAVAPLGPVAATHLDRFFLTSGAGEIGRGRASGRLLEQFAPFAMSVTQGMTDKDPHADVRRDVCQFVDDRLSDAQRLGFVHELLQREMAEARVHLDRIQRYTKALEDPLRHTPEVAQALATIARDDGTRERYLAFARDADKPAVRTRMIRVARDLGWLSEAQRWTELALMLGELQARSTLGIAELDLACSLNQEQDLDGAFNRRVSAGSPADDLPHAAIRACLGSAEGRERTLVGLVSPDEVDVRIAQAYLRHRPITDDAELRGVAAAIARMPPTAAQVLALESLGRHYVTDRVILDQLVSLYSQTTSAPVQVAVAGILIRADRGAMTSLRLALTLQKDRLPSAAGDSIIDALIRVLSSP
jgi:hypothetical protein